MPRCLIDTNILISASIIKITQEKIFKIFSVNGNNFELAGNFLDSIQIQIGVIAGDAPVQAALPQGAYPLRRE